MEYEQMISKVIAVIGSKNSGKTTIIEILTKELARRGYKVAVIKHISEPHFTVDREGKDTWRFAKAGAKVILGVAPHEVFIIEKIEEENFRLEEALKKCREANVIFLEGFKKVVSKAKDIQKIVAVKSKEEALEALRLFEPILAFAGPYFAKGINAKVPYYNMLEDSDVINLVDKILAM